MKRIPTIISIIFLLFCQNLYGKRLLNISNNDSSSNSWKVYEHTRMGIQLTYPLRLQIKIEYEYDKNACDSTIVIGCCKDDFIEIVRIYQTKSEFKEIASREEFFNGFSDSDDTTYKPTPLNWYYFPNNSPSSKVELLTWKDWVGFKGVGWARTHNPEGGIAGGYEITKYFLINTRENGCRIVITFYDDEVYGVLDVSDFRKIVESIVLKEDK
jgi:hypothetical protein